MLTYVLYFLFYVFLAGMFIAIGYHIAVREYGKEVRFYKDCIQNQRLTVISQDAELKALREELKSFPDLDREWEKVDGLIKDPVQHDSYGEGFLMGRRFECTVLKLKKAGRI